MSIFKCPNCYGEGLPADEVPCWKCGSGKVRQPDPPTAPVAPPRLSAAWADPVSCPTCREGYLVERHGRFGQFFGCTRYPQCRCTMNMRDLMSLLDPDPEEPRYGE